MGRANKNAAAKHQQYKRKAAKARHYKSKHSSSKAATNKKSHNWESAVSRYLSELKNYGAASGNGNRMSARCPSSKVRDIVRQTLGYGVAHGVVERRGSNFKMAKSEKSVSEGSTAGSPSLTDNVDSSASTLPTAATKGRKQSILKPRGASKSSRSRSRVCKRSSSERTASSARTKRTNKHKPSRVSFATDGTDLGKTTDKDSCSQ